MGSSWMPKLPPVPESSEELETSEVNNLAAERESTFVSSVGEADSKEQGLREGTQTGDRSRGKMNPNDAYSSTGSYTDLQLYSVISNDYPSLSNELF